MPVTSEQVSRFVSPFERYYSTVSGENEIEAACKAFRSFWQNKILNTEVKTLNEVDDIDPIIRIIDTAAKRRYKYETNAERDKLKERLRLSGQQYSLSYRIEDDAIEKRLIIAKSFQVARTMLTQRNWHEIFKDLKTDPKLAHKMNEIFNEADSNKIGSLIDELVELNSSHRNTLTAPQAVAINALLFCNNPERYSSVVSLAHRKLIVEAFELGAYSGKWSYGQQVVRSNELLKDFNSKFGTTLNMRKISWFFYSELVQPLWKPGRPTSTVTETADVEEIPLNLEGNMPTFHHLEEPEKKEIGEVVRLVEEGQLGIPLFQRDFVWTAKDIVDLFESILRGYFVGSILLWTVNGEPDLKVDPIYGTSIPEEKLKPRYLILDGQQRISSIYYATTAPNLRLWNTTRPYVFFIDLKRLLMFDKLTESTNLVVHLPRSNAERRGLMTRQGQFSKWYFPIFEFQNFHEWLDDFDEFLQAGTESQHEQIREVRKRLRDYLRQVWEKFEVPVIKLPQDMSLVDVAKIFEKLNSTGVVLTVFDLLNARMVKHKIMLRDMWEKVRTSEAFPLIQKFSEGNERFPVYVLQTLALLRDKPTKSEELLKLLPDGFQEDWNRACTGIERALKRATNMRDGFGVISSKWLPYSTMIPVLGMLLDKLESRPDKPKCIEKINKWYWSSIVTHAYSGSTDTQIAQDSREMLEWFENDDHVPQTVRDAKDDLEKTNLKQMTKTSDAVYKAIMCLVALKGGRDFLNENMLEFNTLDDHHIFPQSKASEFKAGDLINAIVNRTLIDKETNEKYIRNSRPSDYLKRIMDEQHISEKDMRKRLQTHLISSEAFAALLRDDYGTFAAKREESIMQTFNDMI